MLVVTPEDPQTIVVGLGQTTPTLTFEATVDGEPANAAWNVDQGAIGTVDAGPAASTDFTPRGTTGGLVHVSAGLSGQVVTRDVTVKIEGSQNGYGDADAAQVATSVAQLTEGGGVNGVGGEGLGGAVNDAATLTALDAPSGDGQAQGLKLIYPYDSTVWPRGLLAPNLMWRSSLGGVDAIKIELTTTSGSFHWKGTFAPPAILSQTGGAFVRHPIPQSVWNAATNTAGGTDRITMSLTIAKGGVAYGPIQETWTIAPARLSGIIYYNSYGTQLAHNYSGAVGGNGMFGGAVLSIHAGDPGPALTAGNDGAASECRVCHSVAANGSRLVAQHGDASSVSSGYDLTPTSSTEFPIANGAEFPGISPDGNLMLAPTGNLYDLPASSLVASSGLSAVSSDLVTSAFSPDGKQVAFGMLTSSSISNPKQKLVVMAFDPATFTFSNAVTVADYTGQGAETRPGWPAFFPTGEAVVYHEQLAAGVDGNGLHDLRTRKGAKARIVWTSTAGGGSITPLDRLNGIENGASYLPELDSPITMSCTGDAVQVGNIDANHGDDTNLNYEPTVNPVASGGYAWVVFTSRRLYGSVAEIPPFCSDPRGVNLFTNITPKKLWVAAIDVTGNPIEDASHPAFYLPGQELLAGNSRGFWVLDPCKNDGQSCDAGDECCGGYCQPDDSGELICSNIPPGNDCSGPQEICTTAADCCDPTNLCINGFCAVTPPT